MQTVDRNLCPDCIEDIRAAQLTFKEVPGRRQETDICDWCGKRRMIRLVRIEYGRKEDGRG